MNEQQAFDAADRALADATKALERHRQEAREVHAEIRKCEQEIERFQAKEVVGTADVVAHENARRRLPRLRETDLIQSQQAISAAETALETARASRREAALALVRAKVAPRVQALDTKLAKIAEAERSAPAATYAFGDKPLAAMRDEIAALQRLIETDPLVKEYGFSVYEIEAGRWPAFPLGDDAPALFDGIVDAVEALRDERRRAEEVERAHEAARLAAEEAARAAEETQRAQARRDWESRMRSPQIVPGGFTYSAEQAAFLRQDPQTLARVEPLAQRVRAEPYRAAIEMDAVSRALVAAVYPALGASLAGLRDQRLTGIPHAHERDRPSRAEQEASDEGSRIQTHHQPELLDVED